MGGPSSIGLAQELGPLGGHTLGRARPSFGPLGGPTLGRALVHQDAWMGEGGKEALPQEGVGAA